jgi:hypothetical protein
MRDQIETRDSGELGRPLADPLYLRPTYYTYCSHLPVPFFSRSCPCVFRCRSFLGKGSSKFKNTSLIVLLFTKAKSMSVFRRFFCFRLFRCFSTMGGGLKRHQSHAEKLLVDKNPMSVFLGFVYRYRVFVCLSAREVPKHH